MHLDMGVEHLEQGLRRVPGLGIGSLLGAACPIAARCRGRRPGWRGRHRCDHGARRPRSALLHGQWIELQAGAGIVDGSDPSQELAETEAKFATLLDALDATTEKLGREAG